jgi:hypothetical protein
LSIFWGIFSTWTFCQNIFMVFLDSPYRVPRGPRSAQWAQSDLQFLPLPASRSADCIAAVSGRVSLGVVRLENPGFVPTHQRPPTKPRESTHPPTRGPKPQLFKTWVSKKTEPCVGGGGGPWTTPAPCWANAPRTAVGRGPGAGSHSLPCIPN